ncbi:MAG TPA: hypothetical protein VGN86_18060 [Pyrinomonadaceae bacterium]|jgi:hypothetical protein|nr:hypothetical protein [Pyrinomonadaceae bacterium]
MSDESTSSAAAVPVLRQTTLSALQVTEQIIVISYDLLPDTKPGDNSNLAAIWQNTNNIPYNQEPEHKVDITGATQKGTFSFPVELRQNSYIIGYSVGPVLVDPSQKYGNVCSTIYIPSIPALETLGEGDVVQAQSDDSFFTGLQLGVSTGDTVSFKYSVPQNCQPKVNKAWVGVFRGSASYTTPPEKAVPMTSNEDSGWMAINHKFLANKQYTLAYFMSGFADPPVQKRMAAILSFTAQ